MTSVAAQTQRTLHGNFFPTLTSIYSDPQVRRRNEFFSIIRDIAAHAVRRPVAVVGASYPCVSRVYAHGVHDIITGTVPVESGSASMNHRIQEALDAPPRGCE
jgi:hypothetical protein